MSCSGDFLNCPKVSSWRAKTKSVNMFYVCNLGAQAGTFILEPTDGGTT